MSEIRKDITSGDWVIVAPGRMKRPRLLEAQKPPRTPSPKRTCPFEHLETSGNWPPIVRYPRGGAWKAVVIPNKYPALTPAKDGPVLLRDGLYPTFTGAGRHELVITRDHNKNFAAIDPELAVNVMQIFQARHRALAKERSTEYVSTFFNWGPSVGASIWHPHYQVMGLPFVPPHVATSVAGAERYFARHHRCVRCDTVKEERREGKRMIEENGSAIAFTPHASKRPLEIRILPTRHVPYFEKTPARVIRDTAALLQSALRRLKRYANDPDLNFFIHDAPVDGRDHRHHHWHIEVVPYLSLLGGFEFSTSTFINVVDPETAASILRGEKIY